MDWGTAAAYVADKFLSGLFIGAGSAIGTYYALNHALKNGKRLVRKIKRRFA